MADSRDKPELETLGYKPGVPVLTADLDEYIKKTTKPNQPTEFPEMCENTKKIVNACKQVVQSAEDYDNDTMSTLITVVQACEQLNCVLEKLKNEAAQGMEKMGFVPAFVKTADDKQLLDKPEIETLSYRAPTTEKLGQESYKSHHFEQPNKNLMIFEQVDGCIKTALELLEQIEVDNTDQRGDKQGCIWTLGGWYKHNLKHLRKAFE